jgi:tRNA-uridine 2-sulfurtransferase
MSVMEYNSETTVVAMSGGVDSSTAAAILHSEGRPIIGLTMQLWNQRRLPQITGTGTTGRCCSLDDVYDARRVAEHLGIPYYVVNYEQQFEETVVRPFVREYLAARTPIPCAQCNNHVKFDSLLATARQIGAVNLATGHYARLRYNPASGRHELLRAVDDSKDQSYFLFGLTQEQMHHLAFPLGAMGKAEVRERARRAGLPVAEKAESQEICFVPNGDYVRFIEAYRSEQGSPAGDESGEIVMTDGTVVARHNGLHRYTIGQRRGLGIALGRPLYVVELDRANNRVVVGEDGELGRSTGELEAVNWIPFARLERPMEVEVKVRHRHVPAAATLEPLDATTVRVRFRSPQRAVTPGQAAVFYRDEVVVGGGWIR